MPDQYTNLENNAAHYYGTGAEIWEEFGDSLDAVVIGVGTGGTVMGVSQYLKERKPGIIVVGVEPEGSLLGGGCEPKPYYTEGIGYDWIPDIFDRRYVDRFMAVSDRETFQMARRLIREEGLLVGGSSGTVAVGMLRIARELPPGAKVLGLFPDGIRNYLGKFVNDAWMREKGFLEEGNPPAPPAGRQASTPAAGAAPPTSAAGAPPASRRDGEPTARPTDPIHR
jgi:cystathionine beta-synthase/cysteine synthase A